MTNVAVPLRALADALDAGMSATALVDDPALAAIFPQAARAQLKSRLRTSGSWASALRSVELVDDASAAILEAGERGGFLPASLRLVADDVDAAVSRRRRALAALAYPAFLVVMASVILPLPLIFTKGVGAYLARSLPGAALTIGVVVVVFVIIPRLSPQARAGVSKALARVPVYGSIVVDTARASTLEVLGRLLAAGLPVTLALPTSLAAGGIWRSVAVDGGSLADALTKSGVVDDAFAARVAVAEKTGNLDKGLPALAEEARTRAKRKFIALSVAAGLMFFLVIAAVIGVSLVAGTRSYFDQIDAATKE